MAQTTERRKNDRSGSSMSSKQMAYAATAGRKVTFTTLVNDQITGYVVGMDDFHWLVAVVEDGNILPTLVHKSAPSVRLFPEATLDTEDSAIKVGVTEMGRGFWRFCEKTYLGRNSNTSDPESEPAR